MKLQIYKKYMKIFKDKTYNKYNAPIAQLDRAADFN